MAKHGDIWKSKCGAMELRCGDYREVLADVECDAVITDPPYSDRTHSGHAAGVAGQKGAGDDGNYRCPLRYSSWNSEDVQVFSRFAASCRGWVVAMTSHDLLPVYHAALEDAGRYVFAPVPAVIRGMTVRLGGDGPSSWAVYCVVARPKNREFSTWGTLPGAYVLPRQQPEITGGKPRQLMQTIIRDYSRKGDLICDPCAGGGTTLLAAAQEGRRAIGAEIDPETFELAVKRLEKGYTMDMFAGVSP